MKKTILSIITILFFVACNKGIMPSKTPIVNIEIENDKKQKNLLGHCSLNMLQNETYKDWFGKNYDNYKVDSTVALQLKPYLQNKIIEIFLGSWCGDSRREVPTMLKILQTANYDTNNIKLIFVNNVDSVYKQSPQREEKGKFIHHVPTFIVYENNKELNRIVETPMESLEKDLLKIVQYKYYTPKYKALLAWKKIKQVDKIFTDADLQYLADDFRNQCLHYGEFNAYGYILMANKKMNEAYNIFKLNTFIYPANANVYDSLAEWYYINGNKTMAKFYYEKTLELNPKNDGAKKMLEKLK